MASLSFEDTIKATDHLDVHFLMEILVKLNLEVFGAAGAVWGFAEICGFRHADNKKEWQWIAGWIGFLFFCRWMKYTIDHLTHKRMYVVTHNETMGNMVKSRKGNWADPKEKWAKLRKESLIPPARKASSVEGVAAAFSLGPIKSKGSDGRISPELGGLPDSRNRLAAV